MEKMRKRFEEIIEWERMENKDFLLDVCAYCPCYVECKQLPEEEYSCEDMYFAYITHGRNFNLKKEKIIKKS
jgi:hypothetical protein